MAPRAAVEIVLRCPKERVFALVEALVAAGARDVTVGAVDYVFRPGNPLARPAVRAAAGSNGKSGASRLAMPLIGARRALMVRAISR